jgi:hypothetical protein
MTPRHIAVALALIAILPGLQTADASCARVGNPKAQEVELLRCTAALAYFEANYESLHPGDPKPVGSYPQDPRDVFAKQLARFPGVVIEVKVLRLREYTDTPVYSWQGPWENQQTPETRKLYLRQPDLTCDSFQQGAVVQLIWSPQCCDTGYFGEIGCHLDLGMVRSLPEELALP